MASFKDYLPKRYTDQRRSTPGTGRKRAKYHGSTTEREVSQGDQAGSAKGAGSRQSDGGAGAGQDRGQHGSGRGDAEHQAAGPAGGRPGADYRAEAGDDQGEEVDCGLQGEGGYVDRGHGDAAQREGLRVSGPADFNGAAQG